MFELHNLQLFLFKQNSILLYPLHATTYPALAQDPDLYVSVHKLQLLGYDASMQFVPNVLSVDNL